MNELWIALKPVLLSKQFLSLAAVGIIYITYKIYLRLTGTKSLFWFADTKLWRRHK